MSSKHGTSSSKIRLGCDHYSALKRIPSFTHTWKIEWFNRFLDINRSNSSVLAQIACRFHGPLHQRETQLASPIAWRLYFETSGCKSSPAEPYLYLMRESGGGSHPVLINVRVEVFNSDNVILFSSRTKDLTNFEDPLHWRLSEIESWEGILAQVSNGRLTVQCEMRAIAWDDSSSNFPRLTSDLKGLLESADNADVTFKLSDGTLISAHKAILSARSPVFQAMFSADMKEAKDNIVEIDDIGHEALEVLLCYIYTGELSLEGKSMESLSEIVNGADKYQLAQMKDLCDSQLSECCDFHNASGLLELALLHRLQTAEDLISDFIQQNIAQILKLKRGK